jgi:hypothetical protein
MFILLDFNLGGDLDESAKEQIAQALVTPYLMMAALLVLLMFLVKF